MHTINDTERKQFVSLCFYYSYVLYVQLLLLKCVVVRNTINIYYLLSVFMINDNTVGRLN